MPTRHRWNPVCAAPTGLVVPVHVDPSGRTGPTRGQARGPRWRYTSPGLVVPAHVTDDLPEQRILEQAARLPAGTAVTGWASCRLWRAAFFDGLDRDGVTRLPVPLALGATAQIRPAPGVVLHRDRLTVAEIAQIAGIPCTQRLRATFDAMRFAEDLREAVVALDMMAAARQVSIRQMRGYVLAHPGWTGVGQARSALVLASEHSRSPNETRMHMVWRLDASLPAPLLNQPVWDLSGTLLGVADLLDPVAGVVGEFDGADHRTARRQTRDVAREDLMRRAGLEYFKVTGLDLAHPDLVADRMLATRARAVATARRWNWTIEPPPWWQPELSLDDELELRVLAHGTTGAVYPGA